MSLTGNNKTTRIEFGLSMAGYDGMYGITLQGDIPSLPPSIPGGLSSDLEADLIAVIRKYKDLVLSSTGIHTRALTVTVKQEDSTLTSYPDENDAPPYVENPDF